MVPGRAYWLLGSDCPTVVSRDLLHCHMISAYSSCWLPLCLAAHHGLHLMYGVVLVCCLLLSTDWLDVRVLCHGHGSPLSEDDSLTHLVIVRSHGTSYPMTDLYYTAYDWLLLSATTPLLIAVVLGSQYFSYWLANCFIRRLSYYLRYSGPGMADSRCYKLGRCGLQQYV